jgi:uroporphyrin-III C-methyltransferase
MSKLLISLNSHDEVHGVIGDSPVAYLRVATIIESGAKAIIWATTDELFPPSVKQHIDDGNLRFIRSDYDFENLTGEVSSCGRDDIDGVIDRLFVCLPGKFGTLKLQLYQYCRKNRIPINIADSPEYSTFSLLSTYNSGDFHLGISTSGKGCKLASRIKREVVSLLPSNIGEICKTVGQLRERIQAEDQPEDKVGDLEDDAITTTELNSLVEEFNMTREQKKLQRNRWLSQIVEYYPLSKLGDISVSDLTKAYSATSKERLTTVGIPVDGTKKKGKISLVGAGPGSVALLTMGAYQTIFDADLILADKLVPQQVIDLIPQHRTKLFIARKFPGNAEAAQEELLTLGLQALERGDKVVRLKQGDPYIFGRGGEEYNFFESHGYTPVVIPGLTSALAAPVVADIPVTHRDVADQVLICTGTGRRGAMPNLPEFNESRTTIFLMTLHRIIEIIPKLIEEKHWHSDLPVAIIERASSPDQRIIRTTLNKVAQAVEACGSRPPGLLVTGYACNVIPQKKSTSSSPTTTTNSSWWTVEEGYTSPEILSFLSMVSAHGDVIKPRDITV